MPAQLTSLGGLVAKSEMERRVESWQGSSEAEAKTVWAVILRSVEFVMFWRV